MAGTDPPVDVLARSLLIVFAGHACLRLGGVGQAPGDWMIAALAVLIATVGHFRPHLRRPALAAALLLDVVAAVSLFPETSNHLFVECAALLLVLIAPAHHRVELCVWLSVPIFLWAGVRKLAEPLWTHGLTLEYLAQHEPRFALVAAIPEGALPVLAVGVALAEVVVGVALMSRRARRIAAMVGLVLVALIEIHAHEVAFGVLLLSLLGPTAVRGRARAALPVLVAALVSLAVGLNLVGVGRWN